MNISTESGYLYNVVKARVHVMAMAGVIDVRVMMTDNNQVAVSGVSIDGTERACADITSLWSLIRMRYRLNRILRSRKTFDEMEIIDELLSAIGMVSNYDSADDMDSHVG